MKATIITLSICLCVSGVYNTDPISDIGDNSIIIEAAEAEPEQRSSRQILLRGPTISVFDAFTVPAWRKINTNSIKLPTTSPCYTNKGTLGKCVSFRQCYPYFKEHSFDNWILGAYDTCSYYSSQGRQMFGVCCPSTSKPTEMPTTTRETTIKPEHPVESNNISSSDIAKNPFNPYFPQISNWPPPIPTHPPDHTIPPLPTHPPSPGYPTLAPPTAWPPTSQPPQAWPPTSQPPQAWPPTSRPPQAWPPTSRPPNNPVTTRPPYKPPQITPKPPGIIRPPTTPKPPSEAPPLSTGGCGAKNGYQDRIVGGHSADVNEWPWIAALFNGGRQFCGGSLIDSIHILSAAHCVAHMSSWDVARLTVRLGDHNIKTNTETRHVEKRVKRVVRHRGFDSRTLYNDIAILTLDSEVEFTHQIRPVCLPSEESDHSGKTATVIGWGSLRESGPQPAILQEVSIPIWTNRDCKLKYGPAAPGGIVEHMICAGQASMDSCSGDSGGPLMINQGKWTQVGIVSWGIGCGKGQYPGVYTRVQNFLPWIYKNLK